MKKLLTLGMLAALSLPVMAQGDLLVGKTVSVLGEPLTWTNANGEYTFNTSVSDHDLSKLTKDPRNTDNVWIFPEGQSGGGFTAADYEAANKEVGIQGFYVDMESSNTLESVYTTWEGAFATAYDIYLTDEVPTKDNLGTAAYSGTGLSGTEQTVELTGNNTGRYLVFQVTDATNWGWGCKIRSLSAYGDTKSVAGITVSQESVPANSSTRVTVTPVNVIGDALDSTVLNSYTLTCDVADAVEISNDGEDDGYFSVKGLVPGSYTLTATATDGSETFTATASFSVTYDWQNEPNIAAGKTVYYRWNEEKDQTENTGDKVTDLDNETYYQYNGDWGGGDGWIVIDLGEENDHVVDAVEVYFSDNEVNEDTGNNTFRLSFGTSEAELPTEDKVWTPGDNWTNTSSLYKIRGAYVSYIVPQEERGAIRYVAYLDVNNPKGKPMIGQIYVAGTEMKDAAEAQEVSVSANVDYIATDETVTFTPLVIDQYGAVMTDQPVTIYVNSEAIEGLEYTPENVGNYTVYAQSGDIKSESITIHVITEASSKINKGNSEENIEYFASKGGVGLDTNPFTQETTWATEELGTSLVIEFDVPVDMELLKFNWEAACPSDYTVSVVRLATRADEGDEETIFQLSGREFVNGTNPVDRIYNDPTADGTVSLTGNSATAGADLSNISTIKVTPTNKLHNYGLRLLSIDVHGTQSDGQTTAIDFSASEETPAVVDVINLQGVVVKRGVNAANALENLPKGIYIVGGKKVAL